jgi:glyoxylase-like metal-dependent hydrolase (beta-lactamase superfamily II)
MIEEVMKDIFRIGVTLPQNPLKELNSYFIRGDNSDLLIDTGFRRQECQESLDAGLSELRSDPKRLDVLVTHLHADHSGLASRFAREGGCVYMSHADMKSMSDFLAGEFENTQHARFLEEGFPEEMLEVIYTTNPAHTMASDSVDNFCGLEDGEMLRVGDYELQLVLVPGHTPGNGMFWMKEQETMFTGDHVLFDITPNITAWPQMEDALGSYLESLRRVRKFPVKKSLPGHRKSGDYHQRIDELLAHHTRRIEEATDIIRTQPGLPAYEIAGRMTWKIRADSWEVFPPVQKWFAVGECMSHLDYLRKRDVIRREMVGGTCQYYIA